MDIDADEHPGDSHARLKTEMWGEIDIAQGVGDHGVVGLLAFRLLGIGKRQVEVVSLIGQVEGVVIQGDHVVGILL